MNVKDYDFLCWMYLYQFGVGNVVVECGMWLVLWIMLVMMLIEIVVGLSFNLMVLFVDGWYMSLYVLVIGFLVFVYVVVCKYVSDFSFVFGIWKIEVLVGYISVIFLFGVVGMMIFGLVEWLLLL